MASKTAIANLALLKLGESRISNIELESVEKARVLNQIFDTCVNSLLQRFPWNFCIKRAALAADVDAPEWGYTYQFSLPSDYLALREIQNDIQFVVESKKILCDEAGPLYIRYHAKVSDTEMFTPLFVDVLAAYLAYQICERITQSSTKKKEMLEDLSMSISQAYMSDSIEGCREELEESTWLEARA